ncbi:MAG: DUF3551 domain-containing protein [Rhodopseudomonas palustris]|uniref:DUF3551 domain-containing protein n=1 Tax=Rhodopseudomonas palustris TaxID=1076 RepID=A0A933RYH8_RHOPL|nr:DUF3551 domain-containing protein [Rhodopseudomonas palustris]
MKKLLMLSVVGVGLLNAGAASAASYKWCVNYGTADALECEYRTLAQCRASASGVGGECSVNPHLLFGNASTQTPVR